MIKYKCKSCEHEFETEPITDVICQDGTKIRRIRIYCPKCGCCLFNEETEIGVCNE